MADGIPKDYSSMYCEDAQITASRRYHVLDGHNVNGRINHNNIDLNVKPPTLPIRSKSYKSLDGSYVAPKHREQTVDLRQVVAKLQMLPAENHRFYALDTLNKHYSSVFANRRRSDQAGKSGYRAYIQYYDEKNTFVVRVDGNSLKAVKDKLPKRGNYRYFFRGLENTCEEVEQDDSSVPFHEKDGLKQIYCQVFAL